MTDNNYRQLQGFSNYKMTTEGEMINKDGKVIGNNPHNNGYTITTLVSDDGQAVRRSTHRWIYEAWYGAIPDGLEIAHLDDNKHNNRPDNLIAATHKQNCNLGNRNKKISEALKAYHAKKKQIRDTDK